MESNCKKKFDFKINNYKFDNQYENYLKCKEETNREYFNKNPNNKNLYPHINNPNFNNIIYSKKEFNDSKYSEKTEDDYKNNIIKISESMCNNKQFELDPHQLFVKNFLSMETPYNGLLLHHGLGTGKTCSAISICEEMRKYYNLMGLKKKIIVVCSKQLQENFKGQIFDPKRLPNNPINGYWNLKTCVGPSLLKEINPTNMRNMSRDKIIRYMNKIINTGYVFYGYTKFKNVLFEGIFPELKSKKNKQGGGSEKGESSDEDYGSDLSIDGEDNKQIYEDDHDKSFDLIFSKREIEERKKKYFKKYYSNCTLVIDEVHNLRIENIRPDWELDKKYKKKAEKKKQKKIDKEASKYIRDLITYADNLKLILLSATPMFNKSKEIIWLLNLLNLNDGRFPIKHSDVFDKNDELKEPEGSDILKHKSIGYISYIRGNNPFSFPHKILPYMSENKNSLYYKIEKEGWEYPTIQLNNVLIDLKKNDNYDLILLKLPKEQNKAYNNYIKNPNNVRKIKLKNNGININLLGAAKQILNISYPDNGSSNTFGEKGIKNIMNVKVNDNINPKRIQYSYKDGYEEFFSYENIGNYSSKIKYILNKIITSDGIILIYSQYIDGGCIPMALALEELGFESYDNEKLKIKKRNLLNVKKKAGLNGEKWKINKKIIPKYVMITGRSNLTGKVDNIVSAVKHVNNKNGSEIKVVIISAKGSEGLDFKNIRQVHIMDPWYNFNRIQQIIGRAIRKLSHCMLPFNKRNVEIFLYGSLLENKDEEAVDLYLYKLSRKKEKQIGKINRILKENAVDCLLNRHVNFHKETTIKQILSSNFYDINGTKTDNKNIIINVNNIDNSEDCDYLECNYTCKPENPNLKFLIKERGPNTNTYNLTHIKNNKNIIFKKIKMLFKDKYIYDYDDLKYNINKDKNNNFSDSEIYYALSYLIDTKDVLFDIIDSEGYLINIGNKYLFQPYYIENNNTSYYNRVHEILNNRKYISQQIENTMVKPILKKKEKDKYVKSIVKINKSINLKGDPQKIYNKLISYTNILSNVQKGNSKSWLSICSKVIENMTQNNIDDINSSKFGGDKYAFKTKLIQLALHHIIIFDLDTSEKIKLINSQKNNNYIIDNEKYGRSWLQYLEPSIKTFLNSIKVEYNGEKYYLLCIAPLKKPIITIEDERKKTNKIPLYHNLLILKESEHNIEIVIENNNLELKLIASYLENIGKNNKILLRKKNLKKIIGFIRPIKKSEFKFYFTLNSTNGINKIISGNKSNYINTIKKINKQYTRKKKVTTFYLNIEIELTLRLYNYMKKDNKIWFLEPIDDLILYKRFKHYKEGVRFFQIYLEKLI